MTIKWRLPRAFDFLLLWHGLFAGSYTVAYLTSEGAFALHQLAGYIALALLAVRLLVAGLVSERSIWSLPLPSRTLWANFGKRLARGDLKVFRGRTPLVPLSGLAVLLTLVVVTLTGLSADWWGWEDLHEGVAEGSLAVVFIHIATVSLGPLLRRLGQTQRA
ncbi:cytochrome b/b6 domain-containing protein [Marinobacteraceae bacterium S3BR75-40.1]